MDTHSQADTAGDRYSGTTSQNGAAADRTGNRTMRIEIDQSQLSTVIQMVKRNQTTSSPDEDQQ